MAPTLLIDHRPPEADDRLRVGDWEGDLIVGRNTATAVATLVDRTSRYLRLVHIPHGRTAEVVRDALLAVLAELPTHLRLTLTWDQGAELASPLR